MSATLPHDVAESASTAALFPLTMTPFEYYYWLDDTPDHPKMFPFEMHFSGQLDQAAFASALEQVRAQHPLFCALVDDGSRIPQWIDAGTRTPTIDWADESVPITHPQGEAIDLRRDLGLRVWVRTGPQSARVVWHVHHACADGVGILAFLRDFLTCYAANATGEKLDSATIARSAEQLRQRGRFAAAEPQSLRTALRDIAVLVGLWWPILFRRTAVLASRRKPDTSPPPETAKAPLFDMVSQSLDQEQVGILRRLASARGATLNDLLLRDMLVVLRDWNQERDPRAAGRVALNMPINLRERDEPEMPATNRIGFGFVYAPSRGTGRDQLLESVRAQTRRIKDWKLGLYFLGGLEIATGIGNVMPWALRRPKSLATMVTSNVGRMFADSPLPRDAGRLVVGNAVLEKIVAVPPLRPLTRGGMAIFEYGNEMVFCLHLDRQGFNRSDAEALISAYLRQLQATVLACT